MGCGWTVAIKDHRMCLSIQGRQGNEVAYSFAGSWNRHSVYYSKDAAGRVMDHLQRSRPELDLEVVHHDELRDREEVVAVQLIQQFFPARNA